MTEQAKQAMQDENPAQHTMGKWTYRRCPKPEAITDSCDHPYLVEYNDGEYEGVLAIVQTDRAEANARLIAAAPETAAKLERMEKLCGELVEALGALAQCTSMAGPAGTTAYIISDARMQQARAAIERARDEGVRQ